MIIIYDDDGAVSDNSSNNLSPLLSCCHLDLIKVKCLRKDGEGLNLNTELKSI